MLRTVVFSFLCFCLALTVSAEILPDYVVTASREGEDSLDANAKVTVVTAGRYRPLGQDERRRGARGRRGRQFPLILHRGPRRKSACAGSARIPSAGFSCSSTGESSTIPDMTGINWQAIQLSSIERIEILDGPSAVLYGSGAVGGVINIITKESAKGLTAEATVSYGSFDTRRALVTGGYGTDTLGLLASADIYRTDGYRDRSRAENTNVTVNAFADVTDPRDDQAVLYLRGTSNTKCPARSRRRNTTRTRPSR